jgi:putative membrane protein
MSLMRNLALSTLLISFAGTGCAETESGTGATTSTLRDGAGRIGGSETHQRGQPYDWDADGPADGGDAGTVKDLGLSALEDGQLLLVADRLNGGEVEQARAALPKLLEASAREFSEQMLVDHQAARDTLLQFSDAEDLFARPSRASFLLVRKAEQTVFRLLEADVPVDELYIDEQVAAHTEALSIFDELIAAADDSGLRDLFVAQRGAVVEHRALALELQAELSDADAGTGDD